jgi:ERF superfamily
MKTSESIAKIAPAFVKFQEEVETPKKTATNAHLGNSYAPLDEIIRVAKVALTKNGLSQFQEATVEGANVHVITRVQHSSGEFYEFAPLTLPVGKNTAQGAGSSITYARRYALCAALGIVADEDDDGNAASQNKNNNLRQVNNNQGGQSRQGNSNPPTAISQAQKDKINKLVEEKRGDIKAGVFVKEHLLPAMNTKTMPDKWSKAQAGFAIKKLEEWGKEGQANA